MTDLKDAIQRGNKDFSNNFEWKKTNKPNEIEKTLQSS